MPRLLVHSFTISLDGYGAGPDQSLQAPLGVGAQDLHTWMLRTRYFQRTHFGKDEGDLGMDNDMAAQGVEGIGAWI